MSESPTPESTSARRAPAVLRYWKSLDLRGKRLISVAAGIFVLAAVILGVAALSPHDSDVDTLRLTDVQRSEMQYRKGREALESGETTAALALLREAVALDPENKDAQRLIDDTVNGDAAADDSSDADTETAPAIDPEPEDPAFDGPIADLSTLLPSSAEGFALGTAAAADSDAVVAGTPVDPGALTSHALWTVHDRSDASGAAEFLDQVSADIYANDSAQLTVDGASAYFGTDGERFASIVYVRGRYVFEVVLTSVSGTPAALRELTESAAAAFPDEPS